MLVVDRKTKLETCYKPGRFVSFLYNNLFGRMILKIFRSKTIARIGGVFMNSRFSSFLIKKAIKEYNIDMDVYLENNYKNYNAFFTRKLKNPIYDNKRVNLISPCDSKLLVLKLDKDATFNIKGSIYDASLVINDSIIDKFYGGYALIFRLEVSDYHRYCYIDSGSRSPYHYINGVLHTVQPISYDKAKVFHQNSREWCVMHTDNFDDVIQCEIGAMLVGKIRNNQELVKFSKGDEKGYFEFGGSTIVLFMKDNIVDIDKDIINNSMLGKETIVHYGEKIGIKK